MTAAPFQGRRWTRLEYERLADVGVLSEDEPVELIGGQLMVAEPKGNPHAVAVGLTAEALRSAFGAGWVVRVQDPVALDEESEPEPDIAVVPGTHRDYLAGHPARAALVVEVAESSLEYDRGPKGSLYARAGLPDYWIVDPVHRRLELHREPVEDAAAAFGWRYARVDRLAPGDFVTPLAAPSARIPVDDLLP
jgi:Uma2 family endonuclease